jgi:hypothetical protein
MLLGQRSDIKILRLGCQEIQRDKIRRSRIFGLKKTIFKGLAQPEKMRSGNICGAIREIGQAGADR